jgi:hypothetical protein
MEIGPLGITFILCNTCKGVFDIYWTENGECINCLEIAEHGETMMDSIMRMEDYN